MRAPTVKLTALLQVICHLHMHALSNDTGIKSVERPDTYIHE
jgi:hypothetical protein